MELKLGSPEMDFGRICSWTTEDSCLQSLFIWVSGQQSSHLSLSTGSFLGVKSRSVDLDVYDHLMSML